jgi:hypothetical protein
MSAHQAAAACLVLDENMDLVPISEEQQQDENEIAQLMINKFRQEEAERNRIRAAEQAKIPLDKSIRFMANWIDNGDQKARVFYTLNDEDKSVTIYASGYLDYLKKVLPAEIVTNDSDISSDYCETDRARIFKESPLYPFARGRQQVNWAKGIIKRIKKRPSLLGNISGISEAEFKKAKEIMKYEKEYLAGKMQD